MVLNQVVDKNVECVYPAQDRVQWLDVLNKEMGVGIQVPESSVNVSSR